MFCVWRKSYIIGTEIRNFTKSFLVYFHPPIVFSTDLMNPLTNNKFMSNYTYKFISKNTNQTSKEAML